jgi:NAD(P)-dependent dehydrogenase (short-subunit alcohol dehydrogenase family)
MWPRHGSGWQKRSGYERNRLIELYIDKHRRDMPEFWNWKRNRDARQEAIMSERPGKVAVITGASSGIGRACALLLVQEGFQVFAGVRRPEDGDKLVIEAGNHLTPLIIDVTEIDSIAAAVKEVTATLQGRDLDGLVNVAGIGITGPLEYVTAADLCRIFQVNAFGQLAVTQAFLPLIRKARGRIVNMSSVGAHIALPFGGVLCASKAAFGMLSDALRMELRSCGVRVSVIEPASINTPAVEKTLGDVEGIIRRLPPDGAQRYGDMLRAFTKRAYARELNGSAPEIVARAVHHALTAKRPRIRYTVGKGAKLLTILPRLLPDRLLDSIRNRIFGLSVFIGRQQ